MLTYRSKRALASSKSFRKISKVAFFFTSFSTKKCICCETNILWSLVIWNLFIICPIGKKLIDDMIYSNSVTVGLLLPTNTSCISAKSVTRLAEWLNLSKINSCLLVVIDSLLWICYKIYSELDSEFCWYWNFGFITNFTCVSVNNFEFWVVFRTFFQHFWVNWFQTLQ